MNYRPIANVGNGTKVVRRLERLDSTITCQRTTSCLVCSFDSKTTYINAQDALTNLVIYIWLDNNGKVKGIYFGSCEIPDRVNLAKLLRTLENIIIRDLQLKLFINYLQNKKHVKI